MYRKLASSLGISVIVCAGAYADFIDGEELIDPTRPLAELTIENDGIDLASIIRNVVPESFDLTFTRASTTNPMAVINNERVTVGDMIGGAAVIAITRGSVTLLIGEEERVIGLYDTSVKNTVLKK